MKQAARPPISMRSASHRQTFPVFLELSGVSEVSIDVSPQGTNVTVGIPRQLAAALGLIPPANNAA